MSSIGERYGIWSKGPGAWRIDPRQLIKAVVYTLLFINFLYYLAIDLEVAAHTAHDGWRLIDWTKNFATTLDELAWFILLLLFELETYLLSDEASTRRRIRVMHAVRLLCYGLILHTIYAYSDYLWRLYHDIELTTEGLCDLLEHGLSFAHTVQYWALDRDNCSVLSSAGQFYLFEQGQLVTDAPGMQVERGLTWADVVEASAWLLIVLLLELMVRLHEREVTTGFLISAARLIKAALYTVLWLIAAYWAYLGIWIYVWDEILWILGFFAIGMNLSDWRQQIEADADSEVAAGV